MNNDFMEYCINCGEFIDFADDHCPQCRAMATEPEFKPWWCGSGLHALSAGCSCAASTPQSVAATHRHNERETP